MAHYDYRKEQQPYVDMASAEERVRREAPSLDRPWSPASATFGSPAASRRGPVPTVSTVAPWTGPAQQHSATGPLPTRPRTAAAGFTPPPGAPASGKRGFSGSPRARPAGTALAAAPAPRPAGSPTPDPVVLLVEGPPTAPRVAGVQTLSPALSRGRGGGSTHAHGRRRGGRGSPALSSSLHATAPGGAPLGAPSGVPADPAHIIGFIGPALLREAAAGGGVPTARAAEPRTRSLGRPRTSPPGRPRFEVEIVSGWAPRGGGGSGGGPAELDAAMDAAWEAPLGYSPPEGWVPSTPKAAASAAAAPPPPPGMDLAALMNRVLERAVRRELTFSVDPGVRGVSDTGGGGGGGGGAGGGGDTVARFRRQQADMRRVKAAAKREEEAARRARAAGGGVGGDKKHVVPRFMMVREREALARKRRVEKRKKKREAVRAVEELREARERDLMNQVRMRGLAGGGAQ